MGTLQSGIELYDGFSAPLYSMINALNLTVSAFESMQQISGNQIDTAAIDGARAAADEATLAFQDMQAQLSQLGNNVARVDAPDIPPVDVPVNPPEIPPVEVPVTWRSDNLDVFTNSGIERFEQEIQSANSMLDQLAETQTAISQQAGISTILSPEAITDIQNLQSRVQDLQASIFQMEQTSLDVGSDQANAQLEHLRAQLSQTLSYQENLNSAMQGMDIGNINSAFLRLSQSVSNTARSVRDDFSRPVEVPVTWNTPSLEVFTSTGAERFEQELQSINRMMNTLNQAQQRISAQAAGSNIFPPNAAADLNNMQRRIQAIQSRIAQIAGNPINLGSEQANNELEQLRAQLDQAVAAQKALNSAVDNLDIGAANDAYNRLSQIVGGTERHIRDNVDEQGRFNRAIQEGAENADNLMNTIKDMVAAYATFQTVGKVIDLSDTITQTTARLSLIVDDGGSVEELQNKIYASAQNARGAYLTTADAISKLGTQASQAFNSNDELIAFTELLNKQFVNAGTSAQGVDSVMLQLTQSMASGKLQGEELNAVLDNAALIVQDIQRYLEEVQGVDASNIKELASEGQITADIIKNAMFYAADDINAKFESMPMTFEQVWQSFQNNALMAFQPVLNRINNIANNDAFNAFVNNAQNVLWVLSAVILQIFDMIGAAGNFVYDNWSWISPIVYGAVAAMLAYVAVLGTYNAVQAISNGIKAAAAIQETIHAAALAMSTGQTFLATAAQYGLNAALLACPITWVVIGIIAFAAAICAAVAAVNHFAGTSVSATGIIAGAFAVLGAFVINSFVVPFWNALAMLANFIGNVFNNPVATVEILFYDMAITVIGYIQKMAAAIEAIINKIPGVTVDITSGLDNFYNGLAEAQQKVKDESGWVEYVQRVDFIDYRDAANAGYSFGQGIENTISNLSITDLFGVEQPPDYTPDYDALGGNAADLANDVSDMAGNTGSIANSLDVTEEELKYLRDIAERDTVNRYTIAEIAVDMGGIVNQVNSNVDLDGLVDGIVDGVNEAIDIVTEGVHT